MVKSSSAADIKKEPPAEFSAGGSFQLRLDFASIMRKKSGISIGRWK